MNIGTIVEAPLSEGAAGRASAASGPMLGEIEEYFVNLLRPGDTFMFAGRLLRFLRMHEMSVECTEGGNGEPMVPAYEGGRLPLTTNLADRVRGLLQDSGTLGRVPRAGAGLVAAATGAVAHARPQRPAGGDVSRAATAGTWSRTASRAATRTRRSACC